MSETGAEPASGQSARDALLQEPLKSGMIRRILWWLLFFGVLGSALLAFAFYWFDENINEPRYYGTQTFSIEKGDTPRKFAKQLQKAGVVDEGYSYALLDRYKGLAGKLHTGYYQFPDGLNLDDVLGAITRGEHRLSYRFTFVQGSTFKQLREQLIGDSAVKQTLAELSDMEVLARFDSEQLYSHPEGLFFPETYAYDPGASDEDIMRRAYDTLQKDLQELWPERDQEIEIKTPYEALILASIIEKETALASERKTISGVFMNRLKKGMKLQTDPTVIYGLGDSYDGNITRKHLTSDTPYNTYTRHGLPPTPICLPGRAAIEAALHPEQTDALYFVAKGDGSGGHTFSKTLSEHNQAVKAYLRAIRKSG